jgi:hypothetical protein
VQIDDAVAWCPPRPICDLVAWCLMAWRRNVSREALALRMENAQWLSFWRDVNKERRGVNAQKFERFGRLAIGASS